MNASQIEAKLIKVRRTIAVDLKAIADLEARIARKRKTINALEGDEAKLAQQLAKAKRK